MKQYFASDYFNTAFKVEKTPRLLSANNITLNFIRQGHILHNYQDRLELLFIKTGSGECLIENGRYKINSGDLIVINAGNLHDEIYEHNEKLSVFSIIVDRLAVKDLPENHLIPKDINPILTVKKDYILVDILFQSIFHTLAFRKDSEQETAAYLTHSLISLVRDLFTEFAAPIPLFIPDRNTALLYDIKKYIDENYSDKDLSLSSISKYFFISQSQLSHLFKRKLGYSPMHYVVRRRIGKAQTLLTTSPKSIVEITKQVGFANPNHFNVQFKKYIGVSPNIYRKWYAYPNILER